MKPTTLAAVASIGRRSSSAAGRVALTPFSPASDAITNGPRQSRPHGDKTMPTTKTIALYTYAELGEKAKERAKQWWNDARDESDYDCVIDDFKTIGEILGIAFRTRPVRLVSGATRYDPCIYWSLGYSQSDYAAFEGTWRYAKGMAKAIKDHAPQDETLHAIADEIAAVFAKGFYRDVFTVRHSDYYGVQVEADETRWSQASDDRAQEVKEIARKLNAWLYQALRDEDEALRSDESIESAMEANGYTFREDGTRED